MKSRLSFQILSSRREVNQTTAGNLWFRRKLRGRANVHVARDLENTRRNWRRSLSSSPRVARPPIRAYARVICSLVYFSSKDYSQSRQIRRIFTSRPKLLRSYLYIATLINNGNCYESNHTLISLRWWANSFADIQPRLDSLLASLSKRKKRRFTWSWYNFLKTFTNVKIGTQLCFQSQLCWSPFPAKDALWKIYNGQHAMRLPLPNESFQNYITHERL